MKFFEKVRRQVQDWRFREFETRDHIEGFLALEKGLKPSVYGYWHEKDVDFTKFETEKKIVAKNKAFEEEIVAFNLMIEKGFPYYKHLEYYSNGDRCEVLCICATQEVANRWKNESFKENGELNHEIIGELVGYPKFACQFYIQNPPIEDRLFAVIKPLGIYFAFGEHQIQELRDFLKEKNITENEVIVKKIKPKRQIWHFNKFLKKKGF